MKKVMMIIVMVAAFVLPTMAQFGQQDPNKVQFQSTSTMQASGSTLASQPMLKEDGTAFNPAESSAPANVSGKRKSTGLPGAPNTEGVQGNTPLGDALLPLSLMALAFAGVVYLRKRKLAHSAAQNK